MTKKSRTVLLISLAVFFVILLLALLFFRKKPARFEPELLNKADVSGATLTEFVKVKLFYFSETSIYLQPVYREIEVPEIREELYNKFIALLLAGDSGHITPVPEGVALRSLYYLKNKEMLVLDFNDRLSLSFPVGTTAELEFIYFMVDNLCYNFREIKKVKFLIGGNESKTLAGHIDLERPFYPNFNWLKNE
ncbi:MAG: GerMN domain-containing protein [Acidobacteria bacterium]|nr:GerMN domain-containing protein [Acidobacteriota bacterium]MBU4308082.1 GerMN domain-containing protein [Acidobacteriota bacterium]MBU4405498.1 GerMN domain-containing protein [Acidobacteriota bacterium]MCG2812285.1 GerMN domain-containing protein [Candidatus Aminicenantes bacterium]